MQTLVPLCFPCMEGFAPGSVQQEGGEEGALLNGKKGKISSSEQECSGQGSSAYTKWPWQMNVKARKPNPCYKSLTEIDPGF